jgi:hypothetical protein
MPQFEPSKTPNPTPAITYLLVNTAYHFSNLTMDQSSLISNPGSRTPSPFENTYESYENTRSNARGELLLNEYKDTAPLAPNKRPPSTKTVDIAPHTDRIISRIRLSLRLLSLCISGTVLGALSHFLSVYVKTKEEWVNVQERYGQRRVWPHWVQMKPMFVLEGVAATATLCSMMLLGAMFFSAVRIFFSAWLFYYIDL